MIDCSASKGLRMPSSLPSNGDCQKVIFLDRDGVINQDSPEYIKSWHEFHFIFGSLDAMAALTAAGFSIIIITNQSIIGRHMVAPATLADIHTRLKQCAKNHGAVIHDIFFCPHTPEDHCACRKPNPGLILEACRIHGIDPAQSIMIGDSAKDVLCARRGGCGRAVLVQTGNGISAQKQLAAIQMQPDHVAPDLLSAAGWVMDTWTATALMHS